MNGFTNSVGGSSAAYEAFFVDSGLSTGTLSNGGKIFAGPRDDPFFVDLGAIFDLAQLRPIKNPNEAATPRDSISYMNVHSIVLEIPLTVANGGTAPTAGAGQIDQIAGVWASASRRKMRLTRIKGGDAHIGPWVQVSRLGLPLINEAVIGLQDKDYWNHLTPADDLGTFASYFLNPILVRDAAFAGYYTQGDGGGVLQACSTNDGVDLETGRLDIVSGVSLGLLNTPDGGPGLSIGDVLRVDLGTTTSAFPNGRPLIETAPAAQQVDAILGLVLCKSTTAAAGAAGPESNEPEAPLPKGGATPKWPYLQPPWEGRSANPRPAPSLP